MWNLMQVVSPLKTLVTQLCPHTQSLRPHELWSTRLLHPWDFSGQNTGMGCHFLLQRVFPNQGSPALAGGLFTTEPSGKPLYLLDSNKMLKNEDVNKSVTSYLQNIHEPAFMNPCVNRPTGGCSSPALSSSPGSWLAQQPQHWVTPE